MIKTATQSRCALATGSALRLELHARGTPHQLATILEEAAKAIRRSEQKNDDLPWFTIVGGSVTYDWRVEDPSLPNTPMTGAERPV